MVSTITHRNIDMARVSGTSTTTNMMQYSVHLTAQHLVPQEEEADVLLLEGCNEKTQRRSVTFKQTATVRRTLSAVGGDYSADELNACWYGPEEMMEIKKDVRETVALMRLNRKIDDSKFCKRGLEHMAKDGSKTRRDIHISVVFAVMDEQLVAMEENEETPNKKKDVSAMMISNTAYTRTICSCKMAAYLTGISDENSAIAILKETPSIIAEKKRFNNDAFPMSPKIQAPPGMCVTPPNVFSMAA